MSTIVVYHSPCQDGFTAAWACWLKHPDWEYFPAIYGQDPPDVTGKDVYLLDYSYKRPVLIELAKKSKSITILDHHKTAEKDLSDLVGVEEDSIKVTFDMNKSGARLAWDHFHGMSTHRRPMLIDYVEDRDLWKFQFPETKDLSAWLFSFDYDFKTWIDLREILDDPISRKEAKNYGEAIQRKHNKDIKELLTMVARTVNIKEYEVQVANLPYTMASDAANLLAQQNPKLFGATYFQDKEGYYVFSLRSIEGGEDVSEIAKRFGGGGHKHAAGFRIKEWEEL